MEQQPGVGILEGEDVEEERVEVVYYSLDRDRISTMDDMLDILEFYFGSIILEKGEDRTRCIKFTNG